MLSAQTFPPWSEIILLTIASPSPLPLFDELRDASARKKRSKICGRFFAAMPGPLSSICTLTNSSGICGGIKSVPSSLSWRYKGGATFGLTTSSTRMEIWPSGLSLNFAAFSTYLCLSYYNNQLSYFEIPYPERHRQCNL